MTTEVISEASFLTSNQRVNERISPALIALQFY